jgi:hypothetical protein
VGVPSKGCCLNDLDQGLTHAQSHRICTSGGWGMHSHVFSLFSKKEFAEKNPRSYSEPCYCISSPLFAVTVAGEYLEPGLGPTSWPHEEKCWAYIYTLLCVGMWEIAIAWLPWANQTNLVQPSSTRSTAPECVRVGYDRITWLGHFALFFVSSLSV